jgi:hypothetical protein
MDDDEQDMLVGGKPEERKAQRNLFADGDGLRGGLQEHIPKIVFVAELLKS